MNLGISDFELAVFAEPRWCNAQMRTRHYDLVPVNDLVNNIRLELLLIIVVQDR